MLKNVSKLQQMLLIVTLQYVLLFSWQRIGFDPLHGSGSSEAFEKKYS